MPVLSGIVLAAGAGSRHGGPKALVPGWLDAATHLLLDGGCARVVVVLGAGADEARALVPADPRVEVRTADDWADGMGASLRVGLAHATGDAVLITLVDLPGTPGTVIDRLLAAGTDGLAAGTDSLAAGTDSLAAGTDGLAAGTDGLAGGTDGAASGTDRLAGGTDRSDALRQATFDGRPGHPVLVGAHHWRPLSDALRGDRGARPYLVAHGVVEVECGDLHHGRDEDA